jgi:predicted methyltransferase
MAMTQTRAPSSALPVALAALCLATTCATPPPRAGRAAVAAPTPPRAKAAPLPRTDSATLAALERILAGAHRPEASRARDAYRHPRETLQFFGVREDQTVMEIWAGPGGWYTELLAPLLRDRGRYIAANWDPNSELRLVQDGVQSFKAKLDANPELYAKVTVTALQYPGAMEPVPAESVDVIVTFRNLHNWMARDAAPAMLKAMYTALKPGGVLGLVDHRADPGRPVDPRARTGYVNEAYAIELVKAAGFEFVAAAEINANPKDTRDYEQGVWTLPPTWRLGDKDRASYAAIGESDRFTLKFVKPAGR